MAPSLCAGVNRDLVFCIWEDTWLLGVTHPVYGIIQSITMLTVAIVSARSTCTSFLKPRKALLFTHQNIGAND